MTTDKIKKEFQKTISTFRKESGKSFPKAMMTGQQMTKRTATVNCGGEWYSAEGSKMIAQTVMNDERFKTFLTKCEATAAIEPNPFGGVQIRIHY